jgi:hypothetical protein
MMKHQQKSLNQRDKYNKGTTWCGINFSIMKLFFIYQRYLATK